MSFRFPRYSVVVISCRIALAGFFAAFRCPANPPLVGGANVSSHFRMFACRPLAGGPKILCDRFVEPCGAPRRFLRDAGDGRTAFRPSCRRVGTVGRDPPGVRRGSCFDGPISGRRKSDRDGKRSVRSPVARYFGGAGRPPDFVVWRHGALPPAGSGFLFACAGPERVATPGVIGRTGWSAMRPKRPSKRIEAVRLWPDSLYSLG